jgi:outer membrane protein assembly factor BamD
MRHRRLGVVVAVLAVLTVAGCAGKKKVVPPEKLWSEANGAYEDEAFEIAAERYKQLLDQHPFDANAEEAELKLALSYYFAQRYAEAISAFGDFERMHPTSQHLAQVEYHLGMAYLAQTSTSDRDREPYKNALTYFRNLVDRFPGSPWSEKARLRMQECRAALSAHEADVATYYLRHGNLKAAEARLRGLLADYPETEATARALYAFAQAYARRDDAEDATLALATLARYHPDGRLGAEARRRLGDHPYLDGADPLPALMARLDELSRQADRQQLPHTVSAYPGSPAGSPY